MVKSSFHDSSKGSETAIGYSPQTADKNFVQNTPPRRAPRMSEGGMFEPNQGMNYQKPFDFKPPNTEKSTESPLQKRPKDIK